MRAAIAAAVAAFCAPAQGAIVGVAESPDGAAIVFHDEAGPCVSGALRAEYKAKDGTTVPGCWMLNGPIALVVFFDTDLARVPVGAIKPPKSV